MIRRLIHECPNVAISVDTRSAKVAEAAVDMGAHIINDVSALRDDPLMPAMAAASGAGIVLMHMQGTPATMQADPQYSDVVAEVHEFLAERVRLAEDMGVARDRLVIDPGVGFGKRLEHNLQLLANLDKLLDIGPPVMVGPSRKRFIGDLAGAPVNERLAGTLSACVMAAIRGARIVRVHNSGPVRQALKVAMAIAAQIRAERHTGGDEADRVRPRP